MWLQRGLIGPLSALAATAVAADEAVFVTARGVAVPTPAVATLGCEEMTVVLRAIDRSGYRRGQAAPVDEADQSLRAYENRVWRRFYADCLHGPSVAADQTAAFREGFDEAGVAFE